MILSDQEIESLWDNASDARAYADALIAATLDKLAAGVSVEPDYSNPQAGCYFDGYTKQSLQAAIAAARVQALEQAANPTDDQLVKGVKAMRLFVTHHSVADFKLGYVAAIRALIGKEST